ncbi:Uma2 family endonuclease [Skermania piniformis]|nr:Uma2 family endonuclease [Skermania piniformis]
MSAPKMTDHRYTYEEWVRLPEDERLEIEVVEGVLVVSPRGHAFHQRALHNIVHRLTTGLPVELAPLAEVDVVLARSPLTVRIPDVIVVDSALAETNPPRFAGSEVHLAVEVLSAGTRRVDRVMKLAEYAEAGIAQYWIVDLDPPITLRAFVLVGAGYEAAGEFCGAVVLPVAGCSVRLDVGALTGR